MANPAFDPSADTLADADADADASETEAESGDEATEAAELTDDGETNDAGTTDGGSCAGAEIVPLDLSVIGPPGYQCPEAFSGLFISVDDPAGFEGGYAHGTGCTPGCGTCDGGPFAFGTDASVALASEFDSFASALAQGGPPVCFLVETVQLEQAGAACVYRSMTVANVAFSEVMFVGVHHGGELSSAGQGLFAQGGVAPPTLDDAEQFSCACDEYLGDAEAVDCCELGLGHAYAVDTVFAGQTHGLGAEWTQLLGVQWRLEVTEAMVVPTCLEPDGAEFHSWALVRD